MDYQLIHIQVRIITMMLEVSAHPERVTAHTVNVQKDARRKNPHDDFLRIDMTYILFKCGGAFSG